MDRNERHQYILQELQSHSSVSASDLSKVLGTSVVTIRKDIQYLAEQNLLQRSAGGAKAIYELEDTKNESTYLSEVKNYRLKMAVAKKASELISSGDSLIVTSGATPHLTAMYASDCTDLRILTDSMLIAEDLCRRSDYQTFILGGEVNVKDGFVHGRDAVRQVGLYMVDKAIVTMDGVDPLHGLTTLRVEGADTLKSILQRARTRILVADRTKIGEESFCFIGDVSTIDVLVTNQTDDIEKLALIRKIEDSGVKVLFAETELEDDTQTLENERYSLC